MPGGSGPKHFNCAVCEKRTKPKERRSIKGNLRKYLQKKLFIETTCNDIICNKCRHKYYLADFSKDDKDKQKKAEEISFPSRSGPPRKCTPISPPSVSLKLNTTSKTHSRCLICKSTGPLVVISSGARVHAFIDNNILIAAGSRCCKIHLNEGLLTSDSLKNVPILEKALLNRSSIMKLIVDIRQMCIRWKNKIDFNFLKDEDFVNLTGLNQQQFNDIFSHVEDKIKNTPARSAKTTLGIFLVKMKSGLSNKILSTIFGVSKSSVRRAISTAQHSLMRGFVPLYIGLESITRNEIIQQHTTKLSKTLLNTSNDQLILVLDGTYIYIQKSGNFQFQRRSFSMHKGRPLVKPMVVVTTTGHFLTILGPYFADNKNNDASILNHMLLTNTNDIKDYIQPEDIFIVDRGFRDSIELLNDIGIQAHMPTFMKKGEKQMSCEDANDSRFVTKMRWVVESANARIKSWKYFNCVLPTNQIPNIGDYLRIIGAICNKYFKPLCSDTVSDSEIANKMLLLSKNVNSLKEYIESNNLERKSSLFKSVNDVTLDQFPQLTEEQLRSLTCGVYQLKMSSSYIQEYLDGNCEILVHKDEIDLLRVKIHSRHISAKSYMLWIRFSSSDVIGWYCKCRAGARVVGMCSHIAAVVWYLSYARHKENGNYGVQDWGEYLTDAGQLNEIIDGSESESEASVIEE